MTVPAALVGSPNWSSNSSSASMPSGLPLPVQSLRPLKIGWIRMATGANMAASLADRAAGELPGEQPTKTPAIPSNIAAAKIRMSVNLACRRNPINDDRRARGCYDASSKRMNGEHGHKLWVWVIAWICLAIGLALFVGRGLLRSGPQQWDFAVFYTASR